MTPPLRFLATVVGGWCLVRAGALLWPVDQVDATRLDAPVFAEAARHRARGLPDFAVTWTREDRPSPVYAVADVEIVRARADPTIRSAPSSSSKAPAFAAVSVFPTILPAAQPSPVPGRLRGAGLPPRASFAVPSSPASVAPRRWSLSSWALWRPGGAGARSLAPGSLGGAQAGVRGTFAVAPERLPGVALAARLSSPLRRRGVEAALGIEWQPAEQVPVRLLAERRQRVTGEGRSAFALMAHGGVSDRPLPLGFDLNAYGAAGVVGARRRDPFVEGAATATRALGPVQVGAGLWGGAQPGVERLDVGPTIAMPVRVGRSGARVSLDYRLRIAGAASPGSGPALTVGTDF